MILRADDIACDRGGRTVLREVSFALTGGQIMTVTGANGSGKSSLLRLLAGLNEPAVGRISHAAERHWIGAELPLKPTLSVMDNLQFWAVMQGGQADDRDAIVKALHRLEIAHLADQRVQTLSSGQKKRVALTRLFLAPHKLWLLDEPEAALDAAGRESLLATLHQHCGDGGAAVIATHDAAVWQPDQTLNLSDILDAVSHLSSNKEEEASSPLHSVEDDNKAVSLWLVFTATLIRDVRLARHSLSDCAQPVMLFILMVALFPLSLGPDANMLAPLAGGLLMVAALFAALLPLERMFFADAHDGTIETLMTTPAPLPVYAAARMAAHWLVSGLPVVIVAPLAAMMLGAGQGFMAVAAMLPATLLFTMIGMAVSALVLSAKRGAVLLALLAAPLYIPVLIFGAGAMAGGVNACMPLMLLWAMVAVMLPLAPLLTAGCLGLMRD